MTIKRSPRDKKGEYMGFELDESQREHCSVEELARVIFCFLKEELDSDYIGLKYLQTKLCPNSERDDDNYARKNRSFLRKFSRSDGTT